MTGSSPDPHRLLAGLHRSQVSLDLGTLDLCFLAALQLRAEQQGLAAFDEDIVFDVFDQVCDLVDPGTENPRSRATRTLQRLRSQRLLVRVDATGIVSAGEYALSGLANVIVQSFLQDEQLTRESLALLTGAIISNLAQIRAAASRAQEEAGWRTQVIAPLRVTVGELVGGIERRQRGLDAQQDDIQREITQMLQTDWFSAVEQCQRLLDTMAGTLQELNDILLRDNHHIQSLLQEVQQSASSAGAAEAESAAQRVADQVERMVAWGDSRQRAWSGYFQNVHRFLRDVVRLDPDRALSHRLVEQLRKWPENSFALVVASDARIRVLRPLMPRGERAPVGKPHLDRDIRFSDDIADAVIDLELLVREALARGMSDLASVTRDVLRKLDPVDHYRVTGRIAAILARIRAPRIARERTWIAVTDAIELEQWALTKGQEHDQA